jgi:iron complex transport system substrate-binding protein
MTLSQMLRRLWLPQAGFAFLLAALLPQTLAAREIVDSAGRKMNVPDTIARVVAAGPPAAALMSILAPEKLVGWNRAPAPEELPFLPAVTRNLPAIGRLTGRGNTANLETIIAAKPDLILDFGTISDTYISLADRTQSQTGIPYVLLDGRFAQSVATLGLLGTALGVEDRAKLLAARVQSVFDQVDATLKAVPEAGRPHVYLARRANGLETSYRGSLNTEIIERAGGINVVDTGPLQGGLVNASLEQILAWNPDTIITTDAAFAEQAPAVAGWRDVDAVRKKRIFVSPQLPYGWVDEPPSLNRILGLVWLEHVFFPQLFPGDMRAESRDFYKLFYQVDLTDAQLDELLAGSGNAH